MSVKSDWQKCKERKQRIHKAMSTDDQAQAVEPSAGRDGKEVACIVVNESHTAFETTDWPTIRKLPIGRHSLYLAEDTDYWKDLPAQYSSRWSYDYDECETIFKVVANGHVVATAEDSEVAHAICQIHNDTMARHNGGPND